LSHDPAQSAEPTTARDRQADIGTMRTPVDSQRRREQQIHVHNDRPSARVIPWDEWVAEDRAAEQLRTSVATLRRMRALGKLPFTKMATHVYYHPDDLARMLANGYGRTA
jgi:hypothetical protein